jgi:RimJ/RimL family protein N-acetyltransferase
MGSGKAGVRRGLAGRWRMRGNGRALPGQAITGILLPMINAVLLREVVDSDLAIFFEQQLDTAANQMAAFTAKNPSDQDAFNVHWAKIRADPGITIQTILFAGEVAGYVTSHRWFGEPEVSYWLGRAYWGQGIATAALATFLEQVTVRPLYARVVHDNIGSRRVLEKCGFILAGEDKGYANARGEEVVEFIFVLHEPA